jgi:DNA-binding MarR family transcriptional regulator
VASESTPATPGTGRATGVDGPDDLPAGVDMAAVAEIRRGATRLVQRMRVSREPGALSTNKLVVLSHLHRYGPTTPGALATAERQQPQSLSRVFTELVSAGLVSRSRDDSDHRRSLIAITAAGRSALHWDMAARDRWLAGAIAGLSDTELGVLRLAGQLMDTLAGRPGTGPAPEVAGPVPEVAG